MLEEHYFPLKTIQGMFYCVVFMNAFKNCNAWKPHWMKLRLHHRWKDCTIFCRKHWKNSFHFTEGGNDPKQNLHCHSTILSFNLYPSRLIFQVGWGLASAKKASVFNRPKNDPETAVFWKEEVKGPFLKCITSVWHCFKRPHLSVHNSQKRVLSCRQGLNYSSETLLLRLLRWVWHWDKDMG